MRKCLFALSFSESENILFLDNLTLGIQFFLNLNDKTGGWEYYAFQAEQDIIQEWTLERFKDFLSECEDSFLLEYWYEKSSIPEFIVKAQFYDESGKLLQGDWDDFSAMFEFEERLEREDSLIFEENHGEENLDG